ncbi:MAG: hypothetical protein H8D74_01445 [Chloroflexi bacterium]|nr:hypothetical protein [Chloroflexota bacterium]
MLNPIERLILLVILLVGCSASVESPLQTSTPTTQPTAASVGVSDALRRDAETMAEDLGISVDEAIRRLKLQDPIGTLGAELERLEADTFAGLWIQHEPEYRIVVAFTRNGEETIQPYVENTPLANLIEVRTAEATCEELKAVQQETHWLLDELGLSVASGINIKENQVELYVTDRSLFDTTLQEANIRLPDHVEVITIYEPLGDDIPFAVTPVPTIHFPQLRTRSATFMEALLVGKLIVKDGCLRVSASDRDRGHLIIWQPDYFLNSNEGVIEILDRNGQVVGRVGEEVCMGGGEIPLTASLEHQLCEPLPEHCEGPYWLQGDGMRLSLNYSSDLFTINLIYTEDHTFYFLRKKPILDDWVTEGEPLSGRLVACYDAYCVRCPRVKINNWPEDYVPLWPADYEARVENGKLEIVDGSGQMVARDGEEVRLEGGKLPKDWSSENYRQLYHELPCGCIGPYWIVKD